MTDITAKLAEFQRLISGFATEIIWRGEPVNAVSVQQAEICFKAAIAYRQHTEAQAGGTEGELPAPWEFIHGMRRIGEIVMQWSSLRPGVEAGETADELEEAIRAYAIAYHRAALASAPAAAQWDVREPHGDPKSALRWAAERSMAVTKEWARGWDDCLAEMAKAKQAVPAAEVVGNAWQDHNATIEALIYMPDGTKLYTAPPATKRRPLSDADISRCYYAAFDGQEIPSTHKFARAIEAAHGITAGTTEQAKEQN